MPPPPPAIIRDVQEKPHLILYYFPECPFCAKVLHFLKKQKKSIPIIDIRRDDEGKKKLIEIGGKAQVPCLVINNRPLYESDDIIRWLKKHSNLY